jgi:CubicO group peptidase (beta-lactamase class C family)
MNDNIEVHGTCDQRFLPVKEAFAENFTTGKEVGASFALNIEGKFVVDIWAGYADAAHTRHWERETIVNVFSSSKVMTATAALLLVDRGLLDLDAPVARYWPEFAQNGKDKIPVRCLFSHSAGLPGFTALPTPENLYNWKYITDMLAGMKPMWEPGKYSGYHGLTMGYLLGELIRRITGKTPGTFFRDEVAVPLQANIHIGTPASWDRYVAEMIPAPELKPGDPGYVTDDPRSVRGKVNATQPKIQHIVNQPAWRRAEVPAANAHGNARAMARIGSALACGGTVDGIHLLSPVTLEKVLEEQTNGIDLVLNTPIRWGLGVELNTAERPLSPHPRTFSWGGLGGSMIVADIDARLCWAYAMNRMGQGPHFLDPRNRALNKALKTVL